MAHIAKSTVLRAIKAGRVSAQRDANGQWSIDPAEFHRVFPPLAIGATAENATTLTGATTDALVAELRAVIQDLRKDRDHWRDAFENAQRLPPSPTLTGATPDATPETPKPVSWWRWLRSTGRDRPERAHCLRKRTPAGLPPLGGG